MTAPHPLRTSGRPVSASRPRPVPTRTRWISVLAVMVLAPWFAEMSWGGYPAIDLPVIVLFLGPMYGGAALLIREVARRTGRGFPTIVLLAIAFGVIQAGLVDQSLFNPDYGRYDFQHPVHLGGIDISLYYLVNFVTGHVVASIVTPIALAETWTRHRTGPWLGRRALWLVGGLYVLATVVNYVGVKDEDGGGFQASPLQVGAAAGVALLAVVAAGLWRRRPTITAWVPSLPLLGFGAFVGYLLYLPGENAIALVVGCGVIAAAILLISRWSRTPDWTFDHTLALVIGSVLVGAVMPFWAAPYDDTVSAHDELLADLGTAGISIVIVAATLWRRYLLTHREDPDTDA